MRAVKEMATPVKQLVLGGARSGKSSYAERRSIELAETHNLDLIYIATAAPGDDEMATRIQRHKDERAKRWTLIEEPWNLAAALTAEHSSKASTPSAKSLILIDCLTLWLSNCLHGDGVNNWAQRKMHFLQALKDCPNHVIMVSNEVGHGIIPMGELTRIYVDEMGWLHQELARDCNHVTLVIAGLAQQLKRPMLEKT